ncbi:MAG: type III toxin-antitoxin system ToxN/AbiQ family toxin [Dehalococcoidia bacterium]|nr:type III toxin-antitoxin system ToxN/AbiQ family toxin [Dehalococcoidia bacterium]
MSKLHFYTADKAYLDYLRQFEPKVPHVDYSAASNHEKFMCGVVFETGKDIRYFAPVSSHIRNTPTNFVIHGKSGKWISCVHFTYMVPIPHGLTKKITISKEQDVSYRSLLNEKYYYCREGNNPERIRTMAAEVYDKATNPICRNSLDRQVRKFKFLCCNFKLLEEKCIEYAKEHNMALSPPTSVLEQDVKKITLVYALEKPYNNLTPSPNGLALVICPEKCYYLFVAGLALRCSFVIRLSLQAG